MINLLCIENLRSINALFNLIEEVDTMHIELSNKKLLIPILLKDKTMRIQIRISKKILKLNF